MHARTLISHSLALGIAAAPAAAETLDLGIVIPRMTVAEYHRPYVAVWLEQPSAAPRALSVWYDGAKKDNEGAKWLADVRQFWRAAGRSLRFPADGISGATRAPGEQKLSFATGRGPLPTLAPGNYTLLVEAAREVGGREVVRLPFAWPPKPGAVVKAAGTSELGTVSLSFRK
ncbi:DUF2271 domain-containing protein [Polymorphobacter fuscus]|uniref:DUF2271 domain-containing protein n=1 Tax=Sandarakinorhabdus fusca TaxID=1439888 RepID=A0A7C9GNW8_9SPHN|nr:DUF2271 domain-containing protein [Polymorphobacter fuscus]KAB7647758.1 DUF2271 domain-containing protein [Polymorphobacter fuscus]MQT17055.1 DUF2271 domain-containing protein [Polymorphobacter fuscus]NJC08953.1 hypothetical protein [Polymorphobacter fuscus]